MDPLQLVPAPDVEPERETAEAIGHRVVVLGAPEGENDTVLELEDAIVLVTRRRLRPAERAEERGHPLDVATGEGEQIHARGDGHRPTLRSAGSALDEAAYSQLAKPSKAVPPTTYRSVEPNMFERIIDATVSGSEKAGAGAAWCPPTQQAGG